MLAGLKTEREQDRSVEREGISGIQYCGDVDHRLGAVGEQILQMKYEADFGGKEGIHFVVDWMELLTLQWKT